MSKTYLIAPFRDKDQVKALGGRWDPDRRQWYVPEGKDLQLFAAWLPSESALPAVTAAGHPPEVGTAGQTLATAAPFPPFPPFAVTTPHTGQLSAPGQMRGVSLSELLSGVSQLVTASFPQSVWVRIEVVAARLQERQGHVYLELAERSDQGALVAKCHAVIWGTQAQRILPEFQRLTGVELAAGIQLLVRARPVFKAQYGFSLEIDAIDAQYTLGDLEAKKRDIRERLQREGLFALNRRLPAPWNYHHVLVIAPQGGAGLGDFQAEASRLQHHGVCQFFYAYSLFQGETAPAQIRHEMLAALENMAANHPWSVDAVVIIRGGGAVNDLAWLNDYALARAICELDIPVLTGIGPQCQTTCRSPLKLWTTHKGAPSMTKNRYSREFENQALVKVRERADKSVGTIAQELGMSEGTLRKWVTNANRKERAATPEAALPIDVTAAAWSAAQRLLALQETHALSGPELHAWCRQRGLFAHQLSAWREAFCASAPTQPRDSKAALRELQVKCDKLQRELTRKERALAETAALLVLQKKYQSLWEGEEK